jgi:hypothetical protein
MALNRLDANQVIRSTVSELPSGQLGMNVNVLSGSLVPSEYDEIALTYVTAGNGIGEIETVTYKYASSPVATLTLSYDGTNKLVNVVRS